MIKRVSDKVLILVIFFISCLPAAGEVYYISPNGNDQTGDGSDGKPWKSLYKACGSAIAGDIIHVKAGTYTETSRCALAVGVTIEGEGNTSIITSTLNKSRINYGPNGANGDAIINLTSTSVADGAQEIRYLKFDGASLTSSHAIYIINRHNVKIHDCTFINFNYCAVAWWAKGTGDGVPPATRLIGSEFYNNIVTDCAGYNSSDGSFYGALYCGGHSGMLIHDNTMIMNGHSKGNQGWPIKFWLWGGMMNGCKIYNNHLEKTDYSVWDFAIESTGEDGMEIFNNTIIGGIDLNKQNFSGTYNYSVYIHDNIIGASSAHPGGMYNAGITLEWNNSHVLIEKNWIKNSSPGILFTPRTLDQTDVVIRYNIFQNINSSSYYNEGITMMPGGAGVDINGFYIYNNVIQGTSGSTPYGIKLVHSGGTAISSATNVKFLNNIILNFNGYGGAPIYLTGASAFDGLYIQNNIFYNNGNSNSPLLSGTPNNYINTGNKIVDPDLYSDSNFHPKPDSPVKDAGLLIAGETLYDLDGIKVDDTPNIGCYETIADQAIPKYVSSVIENENPMLLIVKFDLPLTNIVPDKSSFIIEVNSQVQSIYSVMIVDGLVYLTLEDMVNSGDEVKISYSAPLDNPLQSVNNVIASGFENSTVTNNIRPKDNESPFSFVIAPNVVRNSFKILVNGDAPEVTTVLKIYNISGTLLYEKVFKPGMLSDLTRIDVNLDSGVYLVQLSSGNLILGVSKIIVSY